MHDITRRFLNLAWALDSAQIHYELRKDPDLAILISFEEARELYNDLVMGVHTEYYLYHTPGVPDIYAERRSSFYPHLNTPPYPDGKRVIWCEIEGIKVGIKGKEDT